MGALLCSPLQSGWVGPRKIKAYSVAWRMNQCSRGKPGRMTGFITKTKRYPASSPDVLEVALRRDREVVTFVLVTVNYRMLAISLSRSGNGHVSPRDGRACSDPDEYGALS